MQIPITILTGYLGAGKTTLLNRILHGDHGKRIAVLVNDFGAVNVDAKLVVDVEGETISLANGCICCTIRGDLIESVQTLLTSDTPPDYIVIEASGVSDPAQVVITFNRSALRARVRIDSIITVLDAEQFSDINGQPETLVRDQLRVADIVLLNKVDLVDDTQLEQMHTLIRELVNKARIIETSYCDVPLPLLIDVNAHNPQWATQSPDHGVHVHDVDEMLDHEHHDHSLVFSTWTWNCPDPLSIMALRRVLEDIPISIYRIKGIVYAQDIPDQQVILQMVGKRASLTEGRAWQGTPATSITMIGDPHAFSAHDFREQLDACRADDTGDSVSLVDGILRWLRLTR